VPHIGLVKPLLKIHGLLLIYWPRRDKGRVGLVGWPIADSLLPVNHRLGTGKVSAPARDQHPNHWATLQTIISTSPAEDWETELLVDQSRMPRFASEPSELFLAILDCNLDGSVSVMVQMSSNGLARRVLLWHYALCGRVRVRWRQMPGFQSAHWWILVDCVYSQCVCCCEELWFSVLWSLCLGGVFSDKTAAGNNDWQHCTTPDDGSVGLPASAWSAHKSQVQ